MRANDALRAVAALAASQHGVCTRRQAASKGIGPTDISRLKRAGLLTEPVAGALVVVGAPPTWRQHLMIATCAGDGRAAAAGEAAAALHRLDGFGEGPVEIALPRGTTLRMAGAVVHRVKELPACDLTVVDGVRCTGVARTLVDLGGRVPPPRVLQALDDARRRGANPTWLRATAERLHGPGRKGPAVLLKLLDVADPSPRVPDSWFERLLQEAITCPDLPPLVRQHPIRSEDGRQLARVDLALPELRLGIEGHSRKFHFGAGPQQLDEDRDLAVAGEGWHLLYLGWQATLAPSTALEKIRRAVEARRALIVKIEPGPSSDPPPRIRASPMSP